MTAEIFQIRGGAAVVVDEADDGSFVVEAIDCPPLAETKWHFPREAFAVALEWAGDIARYARAAVSILCEPPNAAARRLIIVAKDPLTGAFVVEPRHCPEIVGAGSRFATFVGALLGAEALAIKGSAQVVVVGLPGGPLCLPIGLGTLLK